jgi:DNA-binding MarR family transcriptional regulator
MGRRAGAGAGAPLPYDRELFFKLVRVVNLTARPFVETLARQHRLSLNEWRTMIVLASQPGVAAHEVVDLTGLDKMSVSRAVAALARHGRIVKRDDPRDARRERLELSAAGRRLYEQIGVGGRAREQQLFGGLDAADRAYFEAIVDRLIAALQTHGAAPAPPRRRGASPGLTARVDMVTIDTRSGRSGPTRRIRRPTP